MISRDINGVQSVNQQTLLWRMLVVQVGMLEVLEIRKGEDLFPETRPCSDAQEQSTLRVHVDLTAWRNSDVEEVRHN